MNDLPTQVAGAPISAESNVVPGTSELSQGKASAAVRLRVWPAVVIVVLQWVAIKGAAWAAPATMIQFMAMMWGPIAATVALTGWWLFASRVPWRDRWIGLGAFVATGALALPFLHPTIKGMAIVVFALPVVATIWAGWLAVTPFLQWPARRAGLIAAFVLAWAYFALLRFDGLDGSMVADIAFRWAPTREDLFLAGIDPSKPKSVPASSSTQAEPLTLEPGDWPGFRGPDRDGRLPGVRIATDWKTSPPRELWRHKVGPGWSSFAVVGNRVYTQEQYGEEEAVNCYDALTGGEIWSHRDGERFEEPLAGPGPRATPTFHEGMIYALGAKGRLSCLNAVTGKVIWSRDIKSDTGAKDPPIPMWGFSSSPLIAAEIVTVCGGGPDNKSVLGYDAATGEPKWAAGEGQFSYGSTQLSKLGGVEQVLIATDQGLSAFEPASGKILWTGGSALKTGMARCIQPAVVGDSDVLLGTGFGIGTERVHVAQSGDEWTATEVWKEPIRTIRPYFNDLVVHQDHIYGFDNNLFTCVSLSDGKSKWKARGYGNGQALLLPDQDLLLILSETGEVALVAAKPDRHGELARFKAIEGKTWNHPVIAHGKLFVRNGEEAACFELTEEGEKDVAISNRH